MPIARTLSRSPGRGPNATRFRTWMIARSVLAARGETPAAFGRRCIPPPPQRGCRVGGPGSGCVAPRSKTPGILARRALPSGRIAALDATLDFRHGLLGAACATARVTINAIANANSRLIEHLDDGR